MAIATFDLTCKKCGGDGWILGTGKANFIHIKCYSCNFTQGLYI